MTAALISPGRIAVRALQVVVPIIAMIFLSLGSIEFSSGQLSSGSGIFINIACYSTAVCGIYYVVALGVLKLTDSVPNVLYQRVMDAVLFVMLLVAGIVHATSETVKNCASYNLMFKTYHGSNIFRCGNTTTAIVLTFVACLLCMVTLVWSCVRDTYKSVKGDSLETALAQEEANAAVNGYSEAATPGKRTGPSSDEISRKLDLQHPVLKWTRRGVRVLQFVFSMVAFILFIESYKSYYSGQYVSPAATYVILMSYSGWVYALWHVVVVESFKLSRRPRIGVERLVDVLLAVLFLVAGIIFAVSSQVTDCEDTNALLERYHMGSTLYRCGNMSAGYVFSFVAVVLYVITCALSFLFRSNVGTTMETTEAGLQV